jgi:hypothetical protein
MLENIFKCVMIDLVNEGKVKPNIIKIDNCNKMMNLKKMGYGVTIFDEEYGKLIVFNKK